MRRFSLHTTPALVEDIHAFLRQYGSGKTQLPRLRQTAKNEKVTAAPLHREITDLQSAQPSTGVPRLYADFNAQLDCGGPDRPGLVHLERLGTLRDLGEARLRLHDGLALVLYTDSSENEDLEIEVTARWFTDPKMVRGGCWVGEFNPKEFRDVPTSAIRSVREWFPCGACGTNLATDIQSTGLNSKSQCRVCGFRIHSLIDPPESDARDHSAS